MSKYIHSKTPSSTIIKTRRDGSVNIPRGLSTEHKRKAENHITVERMFGEFFPEFGSSLGVVYSSYTGSISKNHRI